ncbi:MAG: T9SS type A sorting domain-containing protein [Bacteroidales bacterium]|nr:T9SS type A sorting domain-containing protein [Bacteroidales bacterium]
MINDYSWSQIVEYETHLQNPFYDKIWIQLFPTGGLDYFGISYLCGNHPTNKTYTKKQIYAAGHNGCSYTINPRDIINFFGKETVVLRNGFSAMGNSNFTAKLACGAIPVISNVRPQYLVNRNCPTIYCNIYPNPTKGIVYIECNDMLELIGSNTFSVTIFDVRGSVVLSELFKDKHTVSLNIEKLLPGEYCIKLESEGIMYKSQLILQ